jgi:hypothetical protein
MKWFRWYRGTSENPKFSLVARRANKPGIIGEGDRVCGAVSLTDVLAVWCVILEDAGNKKHWGTCSKDAEFVAAVLQWNELEVSSIITEMVKIGLLDEPSDNGHHVANWEQYQYASDSDPTNADRQRRYYNKHKTLNKRKPNALAKRPDTEADTEAETEKESSSPSSPIESKSSSFGEAKCEKASKPRNGAVSRKAGGRVYVVKGSTEWEAYAADYRAARGEEPNTNPDGGRWFKLLGEDSFHVKHPE